MTDLKKDTPNSSKVLSKPQYGYWFNRISFFLLAFLLSTVLLTLKRSEDIGIEEFIVGDPAPRSLFAPIEVTYPNEKATLEARQQKMDTVEPILVRHSESEKEMHEAADHLFQQMNEKIDAAQNQTPVDFSNLSLPLSNESRQALTEKERLQDARKYLEAIFENVLKAGVIDLQKKNNLIDQGHQTVTLLDPASAGEIQKPTQELMTEEEAQEMAGETLANMNLSNRRLARSVYEIFVAILKPNLIENEKEWHERRKKAAESIPPVEEVIKKNELIVQRGRLITSEDKTRLDRIRKAQKKQKVINEFSAIGFLAFTAYFFNFIFLYAFERRVLRSIRMTLLMLMITLFALGLSKLASLTLSNWMYLIPTALAPLLVALLINVRLGLASATMMTILAASLVQFDAQFILSTLLTGFAATFASIRFRKRIEFLRVAVAIGLTSFVIIFASNLFHENSVSIAFLAGTYGFANGLITVAICFFVLPLFEFFFGMTTDITLLELSDLNHPLLKRLIVEAPGTYHHSLVVSTLAEAACEAIGANGLLARVGCYFHDIGKIPKSEFFTENQNKKYSSKHEKLSPSASCHIILDHVYDGVKLGRQYKLRERILQFIPEHQGTGVIYYFYRKAMDQAKPGQHISPDDFRYPGPKPQSKETAVAMLADSTEAASRSLSNHTDQMIRQVVRKVINDKFIDGQLDECDLTLRDLYRIQESFVSNLMAIYHTRVKYPDPQPQQETEKTDLFKEGQFSKFRQDEENPC